MELPRLKVISQYRQMLDKFLGLNQGDVIGEGEFSSMRNMTSDKYPVLSTRAKRGQVMDIYEYFDAKELISVMEKDGKLYIVAKGEDGKFLFCDGKRIMNVSNGNHMVAMGAYICIFPDKKWFNTATGEYGLMESTFDFDTAAREAAILSQENESETEMSSMMYLTPSDIGGELPANMFNTATKAPEAPVNGMFWMDSSGGDTGEYSLKKYDEGSGMWIEQDANYACLFWCGIHKYFSEGDTIRIEGFTNTDRVLSMDLINCNHTVVAVKENALIITVHHPFNRVEANIADDSPNLKVVRAIPRMDFVIECENRLWGCRYGEVDGEMVNEIYASKLGDFKNWYSFEGISTDSYMVSLGSDGPFTGAVNYLGYPTFFKENCIHKIYGNMPSAYQLSTTVCRGVEQGSSKSLAVVNEVLYYKSSQGVCAYDGSQPVCVSEVLKNKYKNAVAGGFNGKYYVSMENENGYGMFVYDAVRRLWHQEDDIKVWKFINVSGDLQFISGDELYSVTGQGELEEDFSWEVCTGVIGYAYPDKKYLSRFTIRAGMTPGTNMRIYAEYDSSGRWEYAGEVKGMKLGTFLIPVRPKRCDHMRIKLVGKGECKIFSFTKVLELGSDY